MPSISFEYFPATTDVQHAKLQEIVSRLDFWQPDFISITYGAAGSSQGRTFDSVIDFNKNTARKTAAHITCAGSEQEDILALADRYWQAGVRDLVALRGDARPDSTPPKKGFRYASDLVSALKEQHDFTLRVATYPEKHPQAPSLEADIAALKIKLDNGADEALSQFFFDPEVFLRFRDEAAKQGIDGAKLVPGILPIKNYQQIARFAEQCQTSIPNAVKERFESIDDTPLQAIVSGEFTAELCHTLNQEGVEKFHFYTLNDDTRTHLTLENLEWFPNQPLNFNEGAPSTGDFAPRRAG